ncbi:MAG TPA: hypothetical protein VJM09_09620 [Sphingobium sp.]|nr:hypothetical protein [Sphingobium sp.]
MTEIETRRRSAPGGWRAMLWAGIGTALVAPLVAMQFTDEVRWTRFDFAMAAALLVGTMLIYEGAARFVSDPRRRLMLGGALMLGVMLLWAEGAVGLF